MSFFDVSAGIHFFNRPAGTAETTRLLPPMRHGVRARKGNTPMSTAEQYRRVAWAYLKLAEATSNPKTGASLVNLADYCAKRADQCAARAQSISDPERHADMLRFAGIWLSLTEPAKDGLRGAYEWPRQRAA